MYQHHSVQQHFSQGDLFILACLIHEPKTATACYETIIEATGQVIEPGALSRMLARLERRGWIEASRTESHLRLYQITEEGARALERAEAQQHKEKLQEGGFPDWQRGRKIIMQVVLWILRLYPPAWRERYEAEMMALLEQHAITLWTALDLLVGALDARMDPHYRGLRHLHPWERLQRSWKGIGSALTAFGFAFFLWFNSTADLGIPVDAHCGLNEPICPLRIGVTRLTPAVSNAIEPLLTVLGLLFFLIFLVLVAGWVCSQMGREPKRNWPRLLSVMALVPLLLALMDGLWWTLVLAVPCVALVVESGGAMLASCFRTVSGANAGQRAAKLGRVRHDVISLVLGPSVSVSMVLFCIVQGADLVAWWNLFLQSDFFVHFLQTLVVPFVGTVFATLTVLVFFARSAWALRAVYMAPPKPW